jgi:hypothetical protein
MFELLLFALLAGETSAAHEARHYLPGDDPHRDDDLDREWASLSSSPRWYAEEHGHG